MILLSLCFRYFEKRYPSSYNHGSVENGSIQDQDNRLYKNNQKQPFSTKPLMILRERVCSISSFSDILCKKNIVFFHILRDMMGSLQFHDDGKKGNLHQSCQLPRLHVKLQAAGPGERFAVTQPA